MGLKAGTGTEGLLTGVGDEVRWLAVISNTG